MLLRSFLLFLCTFWISSTAFAGNLHLIDSSPSGFAIYRSGLPNAEDLREWCRLGITEVMVLSGDADLEKKLSPLDCPGLRVIHHFRQNASEPLDSAFLQTFDTWVEEARRTNKRILFRCQCGCHRTGRLAAYYEMKYLRYSAAEVLGNLSKFGKDMDHHPYLVPQIAALKDFIAGRDCRYENTADGKRYCVKKK